MNNILAENIVFANGVSLEAYINGLIKNVDEARIPPINFISATAEMESFSTTHQQIQFPRPIPSLAVNPNVFTMNNNILKVDTAHYIFKTVNVHGVLQFNTVNNTGTEQQHYLSLVPRYYTTDDVNFENPVEWTNHTMQQQLVIPTGTRRASFPFSTYFAMGINTAAIDFVIYASSDVENLSFTFTRASYINFFGLSAQYE